MRFVNDLQQVAQVAFKVNTLGRTPNPSNPNSPWAPRGIFSGMFILDPGQTGTIPDMLTSDDVITISLRIPNAPDCTVNYSSRNPNDLDVYLAQVLARCNDPQAMYFNSYGYGF